MDVGAAKLVLGVGDNRRRRPGLDRFQAGLARSLGVEHLTLRGLRQPIPRLPRGDGGARHPRRMVRGVSSNCRRVVRDDLRAVADGIGLAGAGGDVGF